jgi:hypothetical protein
LTANASRVLPGAAAVFWAVGLHPIRQNPSNNKQQVHSMPTSFFDLRVRENLAAARTASLGPPGRQGLDQRTLKQGRIMSPQSGIRTEFLHLVGARVIRDDKVVLPRPTSSRGGGLNRATNRIYAKK